MARRSNSCGGVRSEAKETKLILLGFWDFLYIFYIFICLLIVEIGDVSLCARDVPLYVVLVLCNEDVNVLRRKNEDINVFRINTF